MKTKKTYLGIMLTLALMLGLMVAMSSTALAESYNLWVGGVQVTSENAGNIDGYHKASYNADTKTLTLNGTAITENIMVSRMMAMNL